VLPLELPESSPRFVVYAYVLEHDDGRKSFPLVLLNWAPVGGETGLLTLHASAYIPFQQLVGALLFLYSLSLINTFFQADANKVRSYLFASSPSLTRAHRHL
jgi:hypothetical protein